MRQLAQVEIKIFEDKYEQDQASYTALRNKLNTEEQQKRADFYVLRYRAHVADIEEYKEEWEAIEKLYKCEREVVKQSDPNSFMPVMLPNIEGQAAAMTSNNISANIKGKGFSDQKFAHVGQVITDFVFKENKINQRVKQATRRYLKFGNTVMAFSWDEDAFNSFGLPDIRCPQITKVFVDGNIRDMLDYQKAEYIIEEMGNKSIIYAREKYGDEIADALTLGNTQHDFDGEKNIDDRYSYTELHVWTRNNEHGNLQRIVMSKYGLILEESDPKKPFYQFVGNKYPYTFAGLYDVEGSFYKFGDGKLLAKVQELMNNLYDEVITASKFSSQARTFIDPKADADPDQFDNDPSHPIIANNPKVNIHTVLGSGVNNVVFMLIQNLMTEVQKITRFSSLMTGNSTGNRLTATQAGIQLQQGTTGIDDKRGDISTSLSDTAEYCLGLCMEFWSAAQALRISEDKEEFEWVDARQLANIPVMVPSDTKFEDRWKAQNPTKPVEEMPKFMQLMSQKDDKAIPQTKQVAFDISVSIGEGLPTNKMALYNIILSLAQIQVPDEATGQPRSVLGYQQVRKLIEDMLGIPLDDALAQAQKTQPQIPGQNPQQSQQQPQQSPVNISPTIPGANMNGSSIGGGMGAV